MDANQHDLITTVAYGDGSTQDRGEVMRLIERNANARALYESVCAEAQAVSALKLPPCPPDLKAALGRIPFRELSPIRPPKVPPAGSWWRSIGLAGGLAAAITFTLIPGDEAPSPSNAVVEATREAQFAFALIQRELEQTTAMPFQLVRDKIHDAIPQSLNALSTTNHKPS